MKLWFELTHRNNNKRLYETRQTCRKKQRYEWSYSPTINSSAQEIECIQHTNHQLIGTEGDSTDQRAPNHSGCHPPKESSDAFPLKYISRSCEYSFIRFSFDADFHLRLRFEHIDWVRDAQANRTADSTSQDGGNGAPNDGRE